MKLTVQLRLFPTDIQSKVLLDTMRCFNEAANYVAGIAFNKRLVNKFSLQKIVYYDIRREFGLTADMAIRVIAQVCESYKRDKEKLPKFKPLASVPYRYGGNYSYKGIDRVSIQVIPIGREVMPFTMGNYQRSQFGFAQGQADLVYRNGKFYLYVTVEFPEQQAKSIASHIGVDLGIVNIATDSTGEIFSGSEVERIRRKSATARRTFQKRNSKSAKRRLKNLSGKQRRYQTQVNHVISKKIVAKALGMNVGIALEDLKGIRKNTERTVCKRQRKRLVNWSFYQLRNFINYKAKLAGVPVALVKARGTSKTCSTCGHCEKKNRKSQESFVCMKCGFTSHADLNAASNIAARGTSQLPSLSNCSNAVNCNPKGNWRPGTDFCTTVEKLFTYDASGQEVLGAAGTLDE